VSCALTDRACDDDNVCWLGSCLFFIIVQRRPARCSTRWHDFFLAIFVPVSFAVGRGMSQHVYAHFPPKLRSTYGMRFQFHFLPRNARANARSWGCMSSVRPSVRPSVTLVDCNHIGWKSWKVIARTISPTPSPFVAKRQSTYMKD